MSIQRLGKLAPCPLNNSCCHYCIEIVQRLNQPYTRSMFEKNWNLSGISDMNRKERKSPCFGIAHGPNIGMRHFATSFGTFLFLLTKLDDTIRIWVLFVVQQLVPGKKSAHGQSDVSHSPSISYLSCFLTPTAQNLNLLQTAQCKLMCFNVLFKEFAGYSTHIPLRLLGCRANLIVTCSAPSRSLLCMRGRPSGKCGDQFLPSWCM